MRSLLWFLVLSAASASAQVGTLTYEGRVTETVGEFIGLQRVEYLAASPDGAYLYAAGWLTDELVVLGRDASSGDLSFVERLVEGEADGTGRTVRGIGSIYELAMAPDGKHLYVLNSQSRSDPPGVTVFQRDASSGQLTVASRLQLGAEGFSGLDFLSGLTVSPDGETVYVGARKSPTSSPNPDALAVLSRDTQTGALSPVEIVTQGVEAPESLLVSPDGAHLYVTGSRANGAITTYRRDAQGRLAFVETDASTEARFNSIDAPAISADGAFIYAVAPGVFDRLVVFARDASTGALTFLASATDGEEGVTGMERPKGVTLSPDGAFVYVGSGWLGRGGVTTFSRDASTGAITFAESLTQDDTEAALEVEAVVVSPDGKHLYTATKGRDAIGVFARSAGTGTVAFRQLAQDRRSGFGSLDHPTISPDGRHLYVSSLYSNAVLVFALDPDTGEPTFVESVFDGRDGITGLFSPGELAVTPDGQFVYVTGFHDDAVVIFSRDASSGQLTFVGTKENGDGTRGLRSIEGIVISPDGAHVYTASRADYVVGMSRDTDSGELAVFQTTQDGSFDVDGIEGTGSVAISPDGAHVYVPGADENALQVLSRDTQTGALTAIQTLRDGEGGVEGLSFGINLDLSPDGAHVYVAAGFDDAISVFARDAGTGLLTFVEDVTQDDGLLSAFGVTVAPDGASVYVAWRGLTALARDANSGQLTVLQSFGADGTQPLDFDMISVEVAPDGETVYAVGNKGLAWFSRALSTSGEPGPQTAFQLMPPRPNPASVSVTLQLEVPEADEVRVEVFDALGRHAATVHHGLLPAGPHTLSIDTRAWAPGIYLVRASTGRTTVTRRLTVAH